MKLKRPSVAARNNLEDLLVLNSLDR